MLLAHADQIVRQVSQSQLVVVGTPQTAFLASLVVAAVLFGVYFLMDALPRRQRQHLPKNKELRLIKAMIVFVMLGIMAAGWDIWWHRAIGRDSFWILPHVFLYSSTILAILIGIHIWRHTREKIWKKIAFVLTLIPLSAPLDNFWHSIYGVEDLSRPVSLSWSPAHALLSLSALAALGLLFVELKKFHKDKDFNFYGHLCLGAIMGGIFFLILPFHPTEGWGQVWGFAGAGVIACWLVGYLLIAERAMKGHASAVWVTMMFLLLSLVSYGKETSLNIIMIPHDRPPLWLFIFSFILPALLLDVTKGRFGYPARGFLAGTLWAALLVGLSTQFFAPEFQYGLYEIVIALFAAALGGLLVGTIFQLWARYAKTDHPL
ncbi:MAG: hypothetical protein A3J07_04730 [Candidatus Doudnabacteria bacterium RIFCSPLOWO2_02_FULL_49_13]|uniref:Uncharacterized protein n=1 Tax=Candidatus Doudnabacteria bacterium RIFCSPHIGHO2_12_FULL_48_16 TaxID=1817838 RepID=A0A1F5PKJ0_9BACT|nr:MAG: hypothetical protein A3B77_01530 [Candidatus Doudnabacteria bacterium RIFCSPHIGHO2_02_FULL_49_24]OGE90210.1 MAG: hypothetical protein A3E29_03870 [Candidatus Doudnabacteria bacterium RIFCSPHIGHO2_12_FULL_48_16]OGF03352.1 MAG: hypothetical protein A3J07_04730 [Candidatus Doudnabacteria bacterium RIFCSPLOWO2_02_FULL_49_13]